MNADKPKRGTYLDRLSETLASPGKSEMKLRVEALISACPDLEFMVAAGSKGLSREITVPKVQLLGLALHGYFDDVYAGSVQTLAMAELRYITERLAHEPPDFLRPLFQADIACFVVPANRQIPPTFLDMADEFDLPVLASTKIRRDMEFRVLRVLEESLAPNITFHGDLVVFCGLGLLILGKSGIGKSDCALDLITHGHQLVADDVVHVRRNPMGQVVGKGKDLIQHHMEIKGLGIINVKETFSVYSVIDEHTVDLVIYLDAWDPKRSYAGFGDHRMIDILGVAKPLMVLPVSSGRNWVNLIQVAVRNHILKKSGHDSELLLQEKLGRLLEPNG